MKTIHLFKISLDSKKFDYVELIYDELNNVYIIKWKWNHMTNYISMTYSNWEEAAAKFKERTNFAKICN